MPILSNFPGGAGSGSGGLTLAAVSGITTQVSSGKVYVKWTDPDDLVVAGSTIAAWGGTLLVRKAGSAPTSRRDGTIVLDSKTRNAYKNTYFCDSGLSNGTKYYKRRNTSRDESPKLPFDILTRTPPESPCVHGGRCILPRFMCHELSRLDDALQDICTEGE